MFTDDPVMDFERYDAAQAKDEKLCCICDEYIDQDTAFELEDGVYICDDCLKRRRVAI